MRVKISFRMLAWLCGLTLLGGCARHLPTSRGTGPRIVSTTPAATQILLQIGAAKTIVGVSPWDKPLLPQSMRNLPVVGNYLHLDEELVLQLAPTALILQESPSRIPGGIVAMAHNHGIQIVNIQLTTFHQLYDTAATLGKISGCQTQAAVQIRNLKDELGRMARTRPRNPPRVVYIISVNPIRVVGADNFMDEEVTLAGGVNVAQRCGDGFPAITRETLVQLNPQVLLIAKPGQRPGTGADDPRMVPWFTLPIAAASGGHIDLITWRRAQMLTLQAGRIIKRLRKIIEYSGVGRRVLK
ncbi:MAG: ABC transporter substrate-binding protein [Phycisphaerae bacterium]